MRISAIFGTTVFWIELILHIVMVLNVFHHSATFPSHDHKGLFKSSENAFLNDPKSLVPEALSRVGVEESKIDQA